VSSYTFSPGDYAARTGHLEPLEDLAYRRMLDQCHLREELPEDAAEVARLIRMRSNVSEVQAVLSEFFTRQVDGWTHGAAKPAKAKRAVGVSVADMEAEGVDPGHARDWLQVRKRKGCPLTPTAWTNTKMEALKAGMTPAQAVQMAAENGWAGFKAAWTEQAKRPIGQASTPAWMAASQSYADAICGIRNDKPQPDTIDATSRFLD
jgi:hypothetical protein